MIVPITEAPVANQTATLPSVRSWKYPGSYKEFKTGRKKKPVMWVPDWLPTSIMVPNPMQQVWACNANLGKSYGEGTYRDGNFLGITGQILSLVQVTHWMPRFLLPEGC